MILTLNDEQREVLELIKEEKKQYGIFFDMGVGKTALILSLIEYIVFDKLEESRTLIIAPATVANELQVWQDEIQKWQNFNYFDYFDMSGTKEQRMEKLRKNKKKVNSITIMSDALVVWWEEEFGNLDMFDMIVVDESSRFKNPRAKKFKSLARMINLKRHRVYLLSGTPSPNGKEDLWSQIYLLDKGERLGRSFWRFLDTYFSTFGYRRHINKINRKIVDNKINDICVYASSEKMNLPPLTEEKIFLKFSPEKQKIFNDFRNEYLLELKGKEIPVLSKQILINKCLQLSNGAIYHDKFGNYTIFDDTKLKFVEKYSEEHPDKNILVFYSYRSDKERLLKLPGAEVIDDNKSKNKWNAGKIKLGIISPFGFQYGGNLQSGGYTIIWFGLIWALENFLQSNKRIHRQGQKHPVKIMYLMMENTWDDYVYKTVITKEIDQKEFLDSIDINKLIEKGGNL